MASRPLSPHLSIYRLGYTMVLSILHRATGVGLSLGLVALVAWLLSLAAGPDAHAAFASVAGHWLGRVAIALWLLSLCYHFANGIRHLCWDMGWGMERPQARVSARIVVAAVAIVGAALLYLFLFSGASS